MEKVEFSIGEKGKILNELMVDKVYYVNVILGFTILVL